MRRSTLILALFASPLAADEIYLKGGGQISGVIVERTETKVTVDIGGGNLTVQMSQVVRIDADSVSPLEEYRTRAAAIAPGDAEGWRQLGRWARNQALSTQAKEAWNRVLKIAPDDPEANQALGRVQLDGRWVSEEESYRARGFVEFEGEWVTPDERLAILDARAQQEAADRQALDEMIAADQAAAAEREAQEQAEHDEYWYSLTEWNSDPLYWGYGGGAVYWPTTPGQPARDRANRPSQMPARRNR
jgi:hypothetical protein